MPVTQKCAGLGRSFDQCPELASCRSCRRADDYRARPHPLSVTRVKRIGAPCAVKDAVAIRSSSMATSIVRGPIRSLEKSGADAVMVGRGPQGARLPGQIGPGSNRRSRGSALACRAAQHIRALYDEVCRHYGLRVGLPIAQASRLGARCAPIAAACRQGAPGMAAKNPDFGEPSSVHRSLGDAYDDLRGVPLHDLSREQSSCASDGEAILNALPIRCADSADGKIVDANIARIVFRNIHPVPAAPVAEGACAFRQPLLALIDQVRSSGSPSTIQGRSRTPRIGATGRSISTSRR